MASLRDVLLSQAGVADLSKEALASTTKLREQVAQRNLQKQLPELIQNRDLGGLVQGSLDAGNTQPLGSVITTMAQNQMPRPLAIRPGKEGITQDVLETIGIPEAQAQAIAGAGGLDAQKALISGYQKGKDQERLGSEAGRRSAQNVQSQRSAWAKRANKIESDATAFEGQAKVVKDALNAGSLPGDAVVFNFLARAVAGEKGPLSDSDISRFSSRAFGGDVQKFENFLSGQTTATLTPDQRAAFRELLEIKTKNAAQDKEKLIQSMFEDSKGDYPLLFGSGKEPDAAVKTRAERFGFDYKDGAFSKKKTQKISGRLAPLVVLASKIKDESVRNRFIGALQAREGQDITEQQASAMEARIKEASQ